MMIENEVNLLKVGDTMREIDNNINNLNFKGIQKPVQAEIVPDETTAPAQKESKEIKDLANVPEATLGKSQISSDSIESDMKFLEKILSLQWLLIKQLTIMLKLTQKTKQLRCLKNVIKNLLLKIVDCIK